MNKHGLSLVELLAVLVLIGLVLVISIPNIVRLFSNSNTRKYDYYEKISIEGLKLYINDNKVIGSNGNIILSDACVKINTLINGEYIKNFDLENCDFSTSYVRYTANSNSYKTYLSCDKYKTEGYVSPVGCS